MSGRPGHVTFVSRSQSAYAGAGTERRSLMCGLDLLNERLRERDDGRTTMVLVVAILGCNGKSSANWTNGAWTASCLQP